MSHEKSIALYERRLEAKLAAIVQLCNEYTAIKKEYEAITTGHKKPSLANICERYIISKNGGVYINELIDTCIEVGRMTERRQLASALRKDHKQRFVNLGRNVWALRSNAIA
jgi:hypothetical protein